MAGFRKAQAQQAALKLGIYGASGSGKTFTSLLIAEGLAQLSGKGIAYVDTERGTDFYSQHVPQRRVHPEAFEFDALYSRSITEVLDACSSLRPDQYSVVVIDSITHLWEACINSYGGKKNRAGAIPMQAWSQVKRPYKSLMAWMLASPLHVLICGRQANDWTEDESTGELVSQGWRMKAESETPYEPHMLIRMEAVRRRKNSVITALVEKDRTGVLAGQSIEWPTFENIAKPLLGLLGDQQASVDADEATQRDTEALVERDATLNAQSSEIRRRLAAEFELALTEAALDAVSKKITPALKKKMTSEDLAELRAAYQHHIARVRRGSAA